MKNILIILTLFFLVSACGDGDSLQSTKNIEKPLACSVFSEDYIEKSYSGATIVSLKNSGDSHPYCAGRFKYNGSKYDFTLTLGLIGSANEKTLEASVAHIKKSGDLLEVSGVGEKAYTSSAMAYQISALSNGNLIHIGVGKNTEFNLEVTKKIANDMFKILDS